MKPKRIKKKYPHIIMHPSNTYQVKEKIEECVVICKKGKNKKFGKKGRRRIWTKGKTYYAKIRTIVLNTYDFGTVKQYYIQTNDVSKHNQEKLDETEFKQRFKIFTKVQHGI